MWLLPALLATARERVSFDFGWRHLAASPDETPVPPQAPQAGRAFDDHHWNQVQLPHDALVAAGPSVAECPDGCSGESFIPRRTLWYRKHFRLPPRWAHHRVVRLLFGGAFRNATVWVNGAVVLSHSSGYTPFSLRLDTLPSISYSVSNVIAVWVDPDNGADGSRRGGSGWWYEGGGLYRHAWLEASSDVYLEQDSLFAWSALDPSLQQAKVYASATVANAAARNTTVCVSFSLSGPDGARLLLPATPSVELHLAAHVGMLTANGTIVIPRPHLWSAASPSLYEVRAAIHSNNCEGPEVDDARSTIGIRSLRFDADRGFALNDNFMKLRGFCDHDSFAVVGMAVPERINLFRAQALRALGGNSRRMSHNPPDVATLDIYDRLGVVVIDENRLFGIRSAYAEAFASLVRRDRNHPSVALWSFCNEMGCEAWHELGGPRFQKLAKSLDPSRETLANMFTFDDLISRTIDVQGFSHEPREHLDECHARLPNKPIIASECCSCNSMRNEVAGCETTEDNPKGNCTELSFNARCTEKLTNASDGASYALGTMVWTLFDYYGEPPSPGDSFVGTYGQFDVAGFPKAAAAWYRTQWLLGVADGHGKPFATRGRHEVHLVETWEAQPLGPLARRVIHAYSSAPVVELVVNGRSLGARNVSLMAQGPGSYAEWVGVAWEAGQLAAIALDARGSEVARATRDTTGPPTGLTLTLDAPSEATGTGSALLLDGQDVALLRAAVTDAEGRIVPSAGHNISISIVSGPGKLLGMHSGDVRSRLPNNQSWFPAHHGLVRAVVRVTSVVARPDRALGALVDVEGPLSADTVGSLRGRAAATVSAIHVEAKAEGLPAARLSVPVSTDPVVADVLAVAHASAGRAVSFDIP